jgi:hypothetical protein
MMFFGWLSVVSCWFLVEIKATNQQKDKQTNKQKEVKSYK